MSVSSQFLGRDTWDQDFPPNHGRTRRGGHVVNTASIAGLTPGYGIYSATKHAVVSVSETLHSQLLLEDSKVKISVLCPGFVRTRILGTGRNRPSELPTDPFKPTQDLQEAMRRFSDRIDNGMPPDQVAGIVIDAIRTEQFYVLTSTEFDDVIDTRVQDILQRRNSKPFSRGDLLDE